MVKTTGLDMLVIVVFRHLARPDGKRESGFGENK